MSANDPEFLEHEVPPRVKLTGFVREALRGWINLLSILRTTFHNGILLDRIVLVARPFLRSLSLRVFFDSGYDLASLIVNVAAPTTLIFLCCDENHKCGEKDFPTFTLNL